MARKSLAAAKSVCVCFYFLVVDVVAAVANDLDRRTEFSQNAVGFLETICFCCSWWSYLDVRPRC